MRVERPAQLFRHLRQKIQAVAYGSPLYRMVLDQGPLPEGLHAPFSDPWPGNSRIGQALIAGQAELLPDRALAREAEDPAHAWLRDLRAVGTDAARRKAVSLLSDWLDEQGDWHEESWALPVLGERLANWISFYEFYAPATTSALEDRLIASMVRQLRHLMRAAPATLTGRAGLSVIKGLTFGGACLVEGERALGLALDLLRKQMETELLPDGGHISRNPAALLVFLRALIDMRGVLRGIGIAPPEDISMAIAKIVPALKVFRHGDGGLALFNGAREGQGLEIETAFLLAEGRGRVLRRLPRMGYERIQLGRALLLVDTGAPPQRPYDAEAHAGLGAFEFSVGKERLIVNCGAARPGDLDWRQALAATAAHSTLTLADQNACEVLSEGGLGRRPTEMTAQRYEQDGSAFVDVGHDAYQNRFGASYLRSLSLSPAGDLLRGRELVTGGEGVGFTLRWHLHPSVQANLVQDGHSVLLRTPSGSGWRLRLESGSRAELGLEGSIYAGGESARRSLQIRLSDVLGHAQTEILWSLARETVKGK